MTTITHIPNRVAHHQQGRFQRTGATGCGNRLARDGDAGQTGGEFAIQGQPFQFAGLDEVDDEMDESRWLKRVGQDSNTAQFDQPGKLRRRTGDQSAAAREQKNTVVGNQSCAMLHQR